MANDSLLKTFLTEEQTHADDEKFIQTMRMLTYRQNIDDEKRLEIHMTEKM